ncbi:MAG: hypothetical protein J6I64_02270, partial [Lachnospiraceae bacterium]|nr:hypothetical protein [Lachnospiraceae bacterium]
SENEDLLAGETDTEEIYIKESTLDDLGEEETKENVVETQPSALTDTVQIYTLVFPWNSAGVQATEEQGEEICQLAVPVFAEDCSYYINKIHYNNHSIDYQEADQQTFLTTVEGMEEKEYYIGMEVVYEQGQIVEAYLKSDQKVWSNMYSGQKQLAWDPEHPPYENTGLEAYTLEREYTADISDVEGLETIGIYTIRINDGYGAVLVVHNAAGDILYAKSISTHEKDREGIFLVEQDGVPSLLWWEATERYNFTIQYNYWVFRLDEMGAPVQSAGAVYSCMFIKYLGQQYEPSQLQLWAQPIYYNYLEHGQFLAGTDRRISEEVYYELQDLNAYHHTTLQAETVAAHEAYWYAHPEAVYENPDFEEYAVIQDLFQDEDRLWMQLQSKERNASVSSNCHFYIRQEIDQYPYEEVELDEFVQILEDRGEVHALLQYENGWVNRVMLEGAHKGIRFINPFYQDQDGCLYTENISTMPVYAHIQYDWSQYRLEAQYEADVSDCEGTERILIYSGSMRDMPTEQIALIKVESADGKVLFLDELDHFGLSKTSYYLGEKDGQAYLVLLYLEDRYSHGEFRYNVFRLDAGSTQLSGCMFDWSVDRLDETSLFPEEEFLLWASKAHLYLEGAECILHADNVNEQQFFYDWDGAIDWQTYGAEIAGRE